MKIRYVADRKVDKMKAKGWKEIEGEWKNGLVFMGLEEPEDKMEDVEPDKEE